VRKRSWLDVLGDWPSPEQRSAFVTALLLALFLGGIVWLSWSLR
jgi:hypothetical protein